MKDERTGGEDRSIRWGIIGCSNVVETKNGVPTYTADHSKLAGIWNRTAEKAQAWVDAQGHGKVYETMEELLADPSIDIVYVATTPNCHKEQAIAVAQANKHCYLEKPIAPFLGRCPSDQAGLRRERDALLRSALPSRYAAL